MQAQVFWQGIFPWLGALVGGGLSAFLTWLNLSTRYEAQVKAQSVPDPDPKQAIANAKTKLEALGTFEPKFFFLLWQAAMQPLFLLALLFPLGKKHILGDDAQLMSCVCLALCALIVWLMHEFMWKETVPDRDTWGRAVVVGALWLGTPFVTVWVASVPSPSAGESSPTKPETSASLAPTGKSSAPKTGTSTMSPIAPTSVPLAPR